MTFIDLGKEYADAKEPEIAPEGPYDLRCKGVEHETDGNKNNIRVQIEIEGAEDYAPIFHYMGLPKDDDDARDQEKGQKVGTTRNTKLLMLKRFMYAFKVPMDGTKFNPNDIPGSTARLNLKQDEWEGRRSNKLVLPPVPENAAAPQATPRRRAS
jgi:hypothetical protein